MFIIIKLIVDSNQIEVLGSVPDKRQANEYFLDQMSEDSHNKIINKNRCEVYQYGYAGKYLSHVIEILQVNPYPKIKNSYADVFKNKPSNIK